jgi:predicted ArsR family transcriptional regulator
MSNTLAGLVERHPLRGRIVAAMRGRASITPRALARELDVAVEVLAYHVRVLCGAGALELVETRPVRGTVEHVYALTAAGERVARPRRELAEEAIEAVRERWLNEHGDLHDAWSTEDLVDTVLEALDGR